MEKVFEFINSLSDLDFSLFGYPTLKLHSDCVDVVFSTSNVIRKSRFLVGVPCDEYRIYAENDKLIIVFTFTR